MDVYTERAADAIYEDKYRAVVTEAARRSPGAGAAAWAVLRRRAMREAEQRAALGDRLSEPLDSGDGPDTTIPGL